MRSTHSLIAAALVAGFVLAGAASVSTVPADDPVLRQIVFPGAGVTMTSPTAINARGTTVGQYVAQNVRRGFMLDNLGAYTSIDYPGAIATSAWGVNAVGDIVGDYQLAAMGPILGYILRHGVWTTVDCGPSLGAVHTFAFGITGAGEVVGEYKLPGVGLGQPGRAYLHSDGACVDITPPAAGAGSSVAVAWSINESDEVVGYYVAAGTTHGWTRARDGTYATLDYPGGAFTNLRGISASGDMVGLYRLANPGPNRGFLLSAAGSFVPFDYPGATRTRVLGINARGDVVGDFGGGDCPIVNCGWVLRR